MNFNNFDTIRFSKNWQVVLFPEVAPENWQLFFDFLPGVNWTVSPLHRADRPHYHILLEFSRACDFDFVLNLLLVLRYRGCVSIPSIVRSVDSWERYACPEEDFEEISDEVDYE